MTRRFLPWAISPLPARARHTSGSHLGIPLTSSPRCPSASLARKPPLMSWPWILIVLWWPVVAWRHMGRMCLPRDHAESLVGLLSACLCVWIPEKHDCAPGYFSVSSQLPFARIGAERFLTSHFNVDQSRTQWDCDGNTDQGGDDEAPGWVWTTQVTSSFLNFLLVPVSLHLSPRASLFAC